LTIPLPEAAIPSINDLQKPNARFTNQKHIVIDCANVAFRYGARRCPRRNFFEWDGVRRALKYYREKDVTVSLVTKDNWFIPLPDDLFAYASFVPCVDGDKSNDDNAYVVGVFTYPVFAAFPPSLLAKLDTRHINRGPRKGSCEAGSSIHMPSLTLC